MKPQPDERFIRVNEDEAFIEVATLLMSMESYRKKRIVRWDPEQEEIV